MSMRLRPTAETSCVSDTPQHDIGVSLTNGVR